MTALRHGAVIVGASIGGVTTAETLREEGFDGRIVLVGDETHLPYNRPPLSKQVLLGEWESDDCVIRTAGELDALDIEVRTSSAATGLDVHNRVLHTSTGPLAFDELIIATGTAPQRHPALPAAHGLRTVEDALRLRDALRSAPRVAVIGSGILGSEIASAARHFGAQTLLVGRSGTLSFGGVGRLLSDRLAQLHREHGVELALNSVIERAVERAEGTELTFGDGSARQFDLVVTMIGGAPRTQWLAGSSLTIADGIVCNAVGQASPGISAVGDVAAWQDPHSGRSVRVEHQSNAIEQAIAVACRIAGGESLPQPTPLFWSEIHKTRVNAYGWFDPRGVLVCDDATGDGSVYTSSSEGAVRGVVGWNASPRAFRQARALLPAPAPSLAA